MKRKRAVKKAPTPATLLRRAKAAANKAKHNGRFNEAILLAGVTKPVPEYIFHPTRKWRFDFAWPCHKLAVEINGGGARGRHNTVYGATKDAEKMNAAQAMGWRVLVFTVVSIKDIGYVSQTILQAMQN